MNAFVLCGFELGPESHLNLSLNLVLNLDMSLDLNLNMFKSRSRCNELKMF